MPNNPLQIVMNWIPSFGAETAEVGEGGSDEALMGDSDENYEFSELQRRCTALEELANSQRTENDELKASNSENTSELAALRGQIQTLQESNMKLEKELQACKDDLFRMQPANQIPDSTIKQRYEDLDNRICDWIDSEISHYTDKWQRKHPGTQPKLFHHNGNAELRGFLRQYPDTGGEHVIRRMIHRYLQEALFTDHVILFSLGPDDTQLLKYIEEGMSNMRPPKGGEI